MAHTPGAAMRAAGCTDPSRKWAERPGASGLGAGGWLVPRPILPVRPAGRDEVGVLRHAWPGQQCPGTRQLRNQRPALPSPASCRGLPHLEKGAPTGATSGAPRPSRPTCALAAAAGRGAPGTPARHGPEARGKRVGGRRGAAPSSRRGWRFLSGSGGCTRAHIRAQDQARAGASGTARPQRKFASSSGSFPAKSRGEVRVGAAPGEG